MAFCPNGSTAAVFQVVAGGVIGVPPYSYDRTGSVCSQLELDTDQLPVEAVATYLDPTFDGSVRFTGTTDASADVFLSWAPAGSPFGEGYVLPVMGQTTVLEEAVDVEAIEDGMLIRFTPPSSCGVYFLRTYFSATDPSHLIEVANHLRVK